MLKTHCLRITIMTILLTYLGLIPFLAAAFIVHSAVNVGLSVQPILMAYSGMIMAFLSGAQWGTALRGDLPQHWFVQSNCVALLAFAGLAIGSPICWLLFLLCLWYCFVLDVFLQRQGLATDQYLICRFVVTVVVSVIFVGQWYVS
jgi:hypothetical protein